MAAAGGAPPAIARGGGHGGHLGGRGLHLGDGGGGMGGGFARDGRKADDKYVHAASDELDRLLNQRMKNICRNC
ncbi:hypothetical protein [Bradyrhizobium sp. 2TAF24]|uniref:hypothetical protein n=1 Tax=Bradyrhizobium sp. 2TAF24 TaxID=3233011 RepID=UPI003F90E99B